MRRAPPRPFAKRGHDRAWPSKLRTRRSAPWRLVVEIGRAKKSCPDPARRWRAAWHRFPRHHAPAPNSTRYWAAASVASAVPSRAAASAQDALRTAPISKSGQAHATPAQAINSGSVKMRSDDGRPIEILLVEDSPSDTELTVEALPKGFVEVVNAVEQFWLTIVKLPPNGAGPKL